MKERCANGCGHRAVHRHHAVYAQHIRQHGGSTRDPRALVPVCNGCHSAHHNAYRRLALTVLPDAVFEFAAELLGGPGAHAYLARYYAGADPRLDALLDPS